MVEAIGKSIMMNGYFYLKMFIALMMQITYCQHTEERFLQANQAYEQHDLKTASDLYESIMNKGQSICYNLGLCYYQQERFVDALCCFLQAERQTSWESFSDIQEQLYNTRNKLGYFSSHSILEKTMFFLKKITTLFSFFGWQIIFFIVWIFMILSFMVLYRSKRYAFFVISFCLVLVVGGLLVIKYQLRYGQRAIVREPNVHLLIGPDKCFSHIATFGQGEELSILEKQNEWYKVKGNVGCGWLMADSINVIV